MKRLVAFVTLSLSLVGPASGQEAPHAGGGRPARDEIFKMIDAYIVSNLQESLELSDEQFVKLLPLVKKLHADRRELVQRRKETLGALRRLLESGGATEAKVAEMMKTLKAQEAEEPMALRRDAEAIDAVLSPVQQAKLRLLEARVEQRIRELARGQAGTGARGRHPGAGAGKEPDPD